MMTGTDEPCARSSRSTSKPSIVGRPTSSSTRSMSPLSARASPSAPSSTMTVAYPADSRPRLTNAAIRGSSSTRRIVVIRTPPAAARRRPRARVPAAPPSAGGRWIVNVAPPPGVSVTTHWPPWPFVIASTIASPSRSRPTDRLPCARSKRRKMRWRDAGGMPAPWSRTHSRAPEASSALPSSIGAARRRVLGGVVGELQPRLQQPVLNRR